MDRRGFLAAAVGAAAAACAKPERELVTAERVASVELGPGDTPDPSHDETDATGSGDPADPSTLVEQSFVATAIVPSVGVLEEPDGALRTTLANPIPSGGPLVFLVDEQAEEWHRVLLPLRPNGSTGWIRSADVELSVHNFRMLIELDDFRLTIFDRGDEVLRFTVGVARDNTPTPGGQYYLTELLQPLQPDSVYGRYAYGLSGYSEVLEEFNGGPGQLGVHGTNDPDTIGSQVSSGCVRLHNDDIATIVEDIGLPLGTPVMVV